MATIAFEVGKGLVQRANLDKYKRHFAQSVVKNLEKNCIMVCDASQDRRFCKYNKCSYNIPSYLISMVGDPLTATDKSKWGMVLDNITLANIHLYNMPVDNKIV
jgi:hypothetical protein